MNSRMMQNMTIKREDTRLTRRDYEHKDESNEDVIAIGDFNGEVNGDHNDNVSDEI